MAAFKFLSGCPLGVHFGREIKLEQADFVGPNTGRIGGMQAKDKDRICGPYRITY